MLYRIIGEEIATHRRVEIPNWDAPDIATAKRNATEIGIVVRAVRPMRAIAQGLPTTDGGNLIASRDDADLRSATNARESSDGPAKCTAEKKGHTTFVERLAILLFLTWMILAAINNAQRVPDRTEGSLTPANMITTIDHHSGDSVYEGEVGRLLREIARKCNSTPGDVGAKASCVQDLLKEDGITESIREILEAVNAAVPGQVDGLNVNEVFAAYCTQRSRK